MTLLPRHTPTTPPQPDDEFPASDWQPGDPLHRPAPHSNYFFNFRDDPTTETCGCGDRADWPQQKIRPLGSHDPIEEFIAAERVWREENQESA